MNKTKIRINYTFKVIWSKNEVAVAIDKIQDKHFFIPITSFYFWPRENSWELVKSDLEDRPWLTPIERANILNNYTKIIKYWTIYRNLTFYTKKKLNLKQVNKDSRMLNFHIIAII